MSGKSKILWTDATWNPITGCTKLSAGCQHCYAAVLAKRLMAMGQPKYANGFAVTLHPDELDTLRKWKKPRTIFVCSMADLFHQDVPETFIHEVFATMNAVSHHRYQVLTKRADRLAALAPSLPWAPHIWAGVTVEHAETLHRIDALKMTPADMKFLSLEPLLGPLPDLSLAGINWVIVAGESGPQARPVDPAWVRDIRDQCITARIPFFFKQWGGRNKKAAGRLLDGRFWNEMPMIHEE